MEPKLKTRTQKLTTTAILSAIASIIMIFDFPLLPMAQFLKLDFSLAIVLLGGLIVGPSAIIPIALIKAVISLLTTSSSTGGVGQLADFIISVSFALPFVYIYKSIRSIKGLLLGFLAGTIMIAIAGAAANMYILLPLYMPSMTFDARIALISSAVIPFNIIKGVIISAASFIIYAGLKHTPIIK